MGRYLKENVRRQKVEDDAAHAQKGQEGESLPRTIIIAANRVSVMYVDGVGVISNTQLFTSVLCVFLS